MPLIENAGLSTAPSEDSRESSAEMINTSSKEISPKDAAFLETEIDALNKLLSSVSNEAARIVTRQHWRKCLIGTERDQSFLVRAMLKHSNPHVYVRVMEDYGAKMLGAASEELLDRALELRLPTINADKLVALLAKAKRLGYDEQDVVGDAENVLPAQDGPPGNGDSDSTVLPKSQSYEVVMVDRSDSLLEEQNRNVVAARSSSSPYQQPTPGSYSQNMNLPTRRKAKDPTSRKFVCPDCTASFAQQGGLTYHMDRKVCHRPAPQFKWFCQKCGKGFTTSGGKLYHEQNKVCESHEGANATPPTPNLQPGLATIKPVPPPHLADGVPAPGFPGRPRSANTPSVPPPPPQQVPRNGPVQYSPAQSLSRSTLPPHVQARPSWPSQRLEPLPQPNVPNYPAFRSSIGPTLQTTPARSIQASDYTPSDISSLDAATQAQLNAKIAAEVARFEKKCRELPDTLSAADREDAINREKRGHATRKSQIRKKFGIQIRTSKLQQANFVNLPGQGDAPILAPISRIDAFRAPATAMTPTYSISTPSSMEQGQQRQRPIMENPDPKRRRLENPTPNQQDLKEQNRPIPHDIPGAELRKSSSTQSPEILEVDGASRPDQGALSSSQTNANKLPKKVQWEALPHSQTAAPPPPNSPPPALRDISNKGPRPAPEKDPKGRPITTITSVRHGGSVEPVLIASSSSEDDKTAAGSNHGDKDDANDDDDDDDDDEEDSDVDLDEDIPARLPPGMTPRRSSSRTRGGTASASASASASVSPGPVSAASAARRRKEKKMKKIGKGLFSTSSSSAGTSRRGSEESRGGGGGAIGTTSRSVVEV